MTDNVIPLGNVTRIDLPPERALDAARGAIKDGVVILGWDKNDELYFASSIADGAEVLWLLKKAERALLEVMDL